MQSPQRHIAMLRCCIFATGALLISRATACPVTNEVGADLLLRLPFQTGLEFAVTQGYCDGSHSGYQIDFATPTGTPVVAASAGTVVEVGSNTNNCPTGCGNSILDAGVYVKIRHYGRTATWYSSYLHLNSRLVDTNQTVSAGQLIGYSGNTGWSTGPHLHFHIRSGPSANDAGVRPTPMQGLELETGSNPISNFVTGRTYRALYATNLSLQLLINRAVQVEWQSKDSYSYQTELSTNLTDWQPIHDPTVGDAGWQSIAVKTDPIPNASFRVQEFPPDTTKRLVNLSDFYLDAASVSSSGSALTIRNLRALSAQSTFEDYFKGTFQFDFGKQRFELTSLLQITNLGVFATRGDYHYSAKDVPSAVTMTNALGAVYAMDTKHSGISTGQVLYMPLQSGQLVSFYFQNITGPFNFKVKDPFGNQTVNYYISAGAGFVYWLAIVGPESGVYQVQFVPATGSSISLTNSFLNGNRRAVTTLTNGTIINVSPAFRANFVDYAKFKVNLSQGQILTMPAGSSTLYFTAVNSRSRAVWEQATGGLAYFQAPATDTYYIFVDNHWAGSDITYSGTVSISP